MSAPESVRLAFCDHCGSHHVLADGYKSVRCACGEHTPEATRHEYVPASLLAESERLREEVAEELRKIERQGRRYPPNAPPPTTLIRFGFLDKLADKLTQDGGQS